MPTHEESSAFRRDYARLTISQQRRFDVALGRFIDDLSAMEAGQQTWFRPGLRVKRVRGTLGGVYEMFWAPDGRGTFSWGEPVITGLFHVEWHRCGDHSIL